VALHGEASKGDIWPDLKNSIKMDGQGGEPPSGPESRLLPRLAGAVLFLLLLTLLSAPAARASEVVGNAILQGIVEQHWSSFKQARSIAPGGMAVCLITPEARYFAASGFNRTPDGKATHFRGASTTKTFTAAAILLLHQQGVINIDDTIDGVFPGTNTPYVPATADYNIPYKSEITIRQLLGHRAGVFDVSNNDIPATARAPYAGLRYIDYVKENLGQPDHTFTFDEMVGVAAANQLSFFPPGTSYHYSNTGYSILGKIIERASGLTYAEFIRQNLLVPNGLYETSFPYLGNDTDLPSPYADGYTFLSGVVYETTQDNMSANTAEGNVVTTPEDLANWARLLYTGQAGINQEMAAMMMDVHDTGEQHGNYGLGCTYTEGLGYGHNGAHVGYMTLVRYNPDNGVAVAVFCSVLDVANLQGQQDVINAVAGEAVSKLVSHPAR